MELLSRADQLLSQKKTPEALEILKTTDTTQLDKKERGFYDILMAEAGMLLADLSLTDRLDNAIETFRFDADTAMFARAKYLKGWLLVIQGEFAQAQEVLLEAYSNYLRCQQLEGAARAMNRMAHVSLRLGDSESAVESLTRSGNIYRRSGKKLRYAAVSNNLAYLYGLMGRLDESLAEFANKEAVLAELSETDRLHYWLGVALVHALKGDTNAARENLDKCVPTLAEHPYEKGLYYEFTGWISFLEGDFNSAEYVLLQRLSLFPESTVSNPADSLRSRRLLGDLYTATQDWDQARQFADHACHIATSSNERAEIAGCYRIFAQIDLNNRDLHSARKWFDRTIDLYDLIKYRYDLAVTRFIAARSSLYGEEERTLMLNQARDYFESENVAHYIEKIDKEIANLRKTVPIAVAIPIRNHVDSSGHAVECPSIVTGSSRMRKLLALSERVAASDMTVLINGETGTGKDLMAKYIHFHSRRPGSFVSVNAAAVPDSMVESELFGYAKGAFTGADREKPGLFEAADGGTFFLDEIAEASPSFQAKLLEVIEKRSVRRLGETKKRSADFRVIVATNQNLESLIDRGQFRADLFHRLNEFMINLPPLRERTEDFPALTEYFLRTCGIDPHESGQAEHVPALAQALSKRDWAGNVRQFRAEINYLVLISDRDVRRMTAKAQRSDRRTEEYQKLLRTLNEAGGNQSLAARKLGIPESTFRYRLAKYRDKS